MSLFLPETDPDDPRYTKRGALYVPAGEGLHVWSIGDTYTVKAGAAQTDGRLTFVEATVPPGAGSGPLPHVHEKRDESFYMLSGELEFLDGDQTFIIKQGDFVHVPMGYRHAFRNIGIHAARMLFQFSPAIPDIAFTEYAEPARPGEQPTLSFDPEKGERITKAAAEWGDIVVP